MSHNKVDHSLSHFFLPRAKATLYQSVVDECIIQYDADSVPIAGLFMNRRVFFFFPSPLTPPFFFSPPREREANEKKTAAR